LDILQEKIHDARFLWLIENLLKAGYLEDWRFNRTLSGSPQGGVITPPTMLQNAPLGAFIKRGLVYPEHYVYPFLLYLHMFYQGADDVASAAPVGCSSRLRLDRLSPSRKSL
jgi:hypothetical protein